MAKESSKKSDFRQLEVLASSLKKVADSKYTIQVGIFGDKNARPLDKKAKKSAGVTNAEIGYVQEMGSVERHIPRRSFLWDTFSLHGDELLRDVAPLTMKLFDKGRVDEYLKQVSFVCTNLVIKAFDTSGWGSWAPNSYRTIMAKLRRSFKNIKTRKGLIAQQYAGQGTSTRPLVDTGQLWQAVSARVAKA